MGKSSFLNAYDFFVKSSQTVNIEDFHKYDASIPIEIEGWFIKEEDDDNNIDLLGTGKLAEPDWVKKWVDEQNIVKVRKIWDRVGANFTRETFEPQKNQWVVNGFGGFHSKLTKYTPTPIFIPAVETE